MIRAQCHNYIKALEGAVVLTFSQRRLSFPLPLSHFQLVNITPGLRPTALPAVPGQLFVGFPSKLCTEMARVGDLHWRWWEATAASWGRQWAWDFIYQLYPQSFTPCMTTPSPGLSPVRRCMCQAQPGSPLATTNLDKELLSPNTIRACSGSGHRITSSLEANAEGIS